MRSLVSVLRLGSNGSFSVRRLRARGPIFGVAIAALTACGGTLGVGDPLEEKPPMAGEIPAAPAPPGLAQSPRPFTYEWQWVNPQATGVALRGAFTLPNGETWSVGDDGTVVREATGVATVMRKSTKDDVLSVVWGRSSDDVWVGGARGVGGILIHWDGKKWSDSYPIAKLPIDALQGLSDGTLVVVTGGVAHLMLPEGFARSFCAGLGGLSNVRDVWVESNDEVWLAGDGVAKLRPSGGCELVDDQRSLGVWGDGKGRIVVVSETAVALELRERTGSEFVRLGALFGTRSQRRVRGGKVIAGSASGHIHVVLHNDLSSVYVESDGYATFDPTTRSIVQTETTATQHGDHGPLFGEVLYGLAPSGTHTAFVGGRGLRGRFDGSSVVPLPFRSRLLGGIAAPDGAAFAFCTSYWNSQSTSVCRWDLASGWSALPAIPGFSGSAGIATSATSLLVSGWLAPATSSPLEYRTRLWNGTSWNDGLEGTQNTQYLFKPLFAAGANDIWAWKDYDLVHFDGTAWTTIADGGPGTGGFLMASGRGPNDVWFLDPYAGLSRWDGSKLSHVASLPAPYTARELARGIVAVDGGVWTVTSHDQADRLAHFNGKDWHLLELPGLSVRALALGPDGKVRMLANGTGTPAIYVVEDSGTTKELDLPEGVYINDIFFAGNDFLAIGEAGATLRLTTIEGPSTR